MFFNLSKIVTFLLDPYFYIVLFLFVAIIGCHYQKKNKVLFFFIFIFFGIVTTNVFTNKVLFYLENLQPKQQLQQHYDAVIVLSGMLDLSLSDQHNFEFSAATDRILKGIELIKENRAEYLIISGGDGSFITTGKSEALLLAKFAQKWGVPQNRIIVEANSHNTFENALETSKIVTQLNLKKLLLVTSAFHMHRAIGCFKKQNLFPDVLAVDFRVSKNDNNDFRDYIPSSEGLSRLSFFTHEMVGIGVYYLTGKVFW